MLFIKNLITSIFNDCSQKAKFPFHMNSLRLMKYFSDWNKGKSLGTKSGKAKSSDAKSGETKSGKTKSGQAKCDVAKSNKSRSEEAKSNVA